MTETTDRVCNQAEAAKRLSVSVGTVRNWQRANRLPPTVEPMGKHCRRNGFHWRLSDLETFKAAGLRWEPERVEADLSVIESAAAFLGEQMKREKLHPLMKRVGLLAVRELCDLGIPITLRAKIALATLRLRWERGEQEPNDHDRTRLGEFLRILDGDEGTTDGSVTEVAP